MIRSETDGTDLTGVLQSFDQEGYSRLGQIMTQEALIELRQRADEIMLGERPDPGFFFQHDSPSGRYEDLKYGQGWEGPSLAYRKIEKMELDDLFLRWIENPLFERVARDLLGEEIRIYRAVLWNKAARGGTQLPWHQDDGVFWGLDRPPSLQIWTAIDDAPHSAGCLEVLPRSHHKGLATPDGGTVPEALVESNCGPGKTALLPANAGESILLHNHTWHRSSPNSTDSPRRALGIAFLSGDTHCTRKRRAPRTFKRVFDTDA
ncbi:MAG: phytanoyl-CoA dioxygenase family protein [Myxococcota bacterium]